LENTSDEVVEGESMDVKANLSVVIVAGGNEIAAVLSETEAHVSKLLLMSTYGDMAIRYFSQTGAESHIIIQLFQEQLNILHGILMIFDQKHM
jgi:hypothetical protein